MGKFKEIYIDYLNNGMPITKVDLSIYNNEMITNDNKKRVTVSTYILESKKQIYKVVPIDSKVHLWDWINCKDELGARVIYSETDCNLVKSQLFEVDKFIDIDILDKYRLKVDIRIK